jgi:hypothetical protein
MQVHLIAGQTDAVVDEVAAFDCAKGRVGIENVGRPFFDCHLRKHSRESARDHAHAGNGLAQLGYEVNASRAGRANNCNFHHDGRWL